MIQQEEIDACKARIKEFVNESTDAEFDAFVAEANKFGFRELTRKLMIVWVSGCYNHQRDTKNAH